MTSTRRSLLKSVAAVPALLVSARTAAPAAEPTPTPAVTPAPSPTPGERKPSLLAQAARERYGKFLTEEQAALLDERMAALERTSARLRSFKFGNGEEPTTVFRVRR
jgi:transposase